MYDAASLLGQMNAYERFQAGLNDKRGLKNLGLGFSYPFEQNQAEWEISIFARGWNAAIEWMEAQED
jgi:hypothetical protein